MSFVLTGSGEKEEWVREVVLVVASCVRIRDVDAVFWVNFGEGGGRKIREFR